MPFIRISLAGRPLPAERMHQLQEQTTRLMVRELGKRQDVTVVAIETAPAACWSAGGAALQEEDRLAQLEAFITAGTNTDEEKAAFVSAAHAMLLSVLGAKATPIYVVVVDVPATNWGYDGKTQAARRLAAQAL